MASLYQSWQKHQKKNPRASYEALVGIFLLGSLLYFVFKAFWALYVFPAMIVIGLLLKPAREALGFLWWGLGVALGRVTAPLVLGLMYFVILTPWSLLFRLFHPDHLRVQAKYKSQWQDKVHEYSKVDFENPF